MKIKVLLTQNDGNVLKVTGKSCRQVKARLSEKLQANQKLEGLFYGKVEYAKGLVNEWEANDLESFKQVLEIMTDKKEIDSILGV